MSAPIMQPTYNLYAPKKATNLTVNASLLSTAKDLDINLSAVFEQALAYTVQIKKRELWLLNNQAAITDYNDDVAKNGVFSDGLRSF
jgi:antitoxin CcdA